MKRLRVLIIDNYDSFTYNLVQALGMLGATIKVARNDRITLEQTRDLNPTHVIISPGPCTPRESGISPQLVKEFAGEIPILGVCLGHQAIAYAFGAKVVRARRVMHGKTSLIFHDGRVIYRGLPTPIRAARYHSLTVEEKSLPDFLEVTARTEAGELMGLRHKSVPVEGVQFHPESFLTPEGPRLLENFLKL